MRIDMHCHVKPGSPDSKISVEEYITILKAKGFGGMLITDHDTYDGYRYWKDTIKGKSCQDFVVLKGIEYDTRNAGHMLVIMPQGVKMRLLETRGLVVEELIDFVHRNGGVLGPAHPCGEAYMSFVNTKKYRKNPDLMKQFDFLETFNACEPYSVNQRASELAGQYDKVGIGGSDAHNISCVGMGYTDFPKPVTSETDLIELIRKKEGIRAGGIFYHQTLKERLGRASKLLVYSFWLYNKTGTFLKQRERGRKTLLENPPAAIDPIEMTYLSKYKIKRIKKLKKTKGGKVCGQDDY